MAFRKELSGSTQPALGLGRLWRVRVVSASTSAADAATVSVIEWMLRRLAEGKVYKQIALELSLSTSTVRTHLHNTYCKLGAVDRAQAVLLATQRGWL